MYGKAERLIKLETVLVQSSKVNDSILIQVEGCLMRRWVKLNTFKQEACDNFEKIQKSVYASQMKQYYHGEEQLSTERILQSFENKPTGYVPISSHKYQAICYKATDLTLTSEEVSNDIENHHSA